MTYLIHELDGTAYVDPQLRLEAWRASRTDDLYSDPRALAEAIDERTRGQSPQALRDILVALTSTETGATPMDNVVIRHEAAWKVIDRLVKEVVAAEEKHQDWRDFDLRD